MLYITFGLLALYYILYFGSLCYNLALIMDLNKSKIIIFLCSQFIHNVFICTVLLGVYSRHFENGGIQIFLYSMCNLYIYALAYLSWPVQVHFREYELDGEIEDN